MGDRAITPGEVEEPKHLEEKKESVEEQVQTIQSVKKRNMWRRVTDKVPDAIKAMNTKKKVEGDKPEEGIAKEDDLIESGRKSSLSERWKLRKESLGSLRFPKKSSKPKQKDPLHQWMVDHSGGTLKEKRYAGGWASVFK
ncbi:hypothetical protein F5B20DRAFT_287530 [Whalleya microplaca]|nr:hypothetical protein F5B20DRAFT_287530 [Whalleya microplaca]